MDFLQKEDILLINKMTVEQHGGLFMPPKNLKNEHALDYLIEAVNAEMFGQSLYPEIHHKAGLYMFNIVCNHIFNDGAKRTGLGSALLFLRLNNYYFEANNNETIEFTLNLASGKYNLEECQNWIKEHMV